MAARGVSLLTWIRSASAAFWAADRIGYCSTVPTTAFRLILWPFVFDSRHRKTKTWSVITSFSCNTTLLIAYPLEHWHLLLLSSSGRIGNVNLSEVGATRPVRIHENTNGLRFGIREDCPVVRSAAES